MWGAIGSMATSSSRSAGSSSWPSAATCAPSTRRRCACTSCWTTSAPTRGTSRQWADDNNVELAYTPHYASWLNRIEAQFKALRYFCLAGTDHPDHATQARLIRRYIAWRNAHTDDPKLRHVVRRANTVKVA